MCDVCLNNAEINKLNAEAVLALAHAASVLENGAAKEAVVARITDMVALPEPQKTEPKTGETGGEDKRPLDFAELIKYYESLGMKVFRM